MTYSEIVQLLSSHMVPAQDDQDPHQQMYDEYGYPLEPHMIPILEKFSMVHEQPEELGHEREDRMRPIEEDPNEMNREEVHQVEELEHI